MDKNDPWSNPADKPRPLPLNNIRAVSAAPERPAPQRIDHGNRASAAGHRIASSIAEAAAIESRFAYTDEHKAAVTAAFEEAKAWRRGAAAAATEEMQRDAMQRYLMGDAEREL